jgi:hypothetical protein
MPQPFSKGERREYLETRERALRRYNKLMDESARQLPWSIKEAEAVEEAARHLEAVEMVERDYFARLPRLTMSRCPFDGKELIRTFDPHGFDGLWWRSDASPAEVPSCPHFCVIRGAVHFNGRKPVGGDFDAHTGPEVPYVIPELIRKATMIAVISQASMPPGYTAYFISYFAERRPPVQELVAHWPRNIFLYTTALGEHQWRFDNLRWDFDLEPWLAFGRVRWCLPGSESGTLSDDPKCPYINLKGERQRLVVRRNHVWGMGLPDGAVFPVG